MKSVNVYKIAQYGTFVFFSLLLSYIAYKCLSDWYLWYDEAGQFYISKGLYHYSEPFASYSGVGNVIYYNRYFNLDPGGFSVLLHYWSMLSNHYAYLRLLPLLFFLVSIFVAYKIGLQLFNAHLPAVLLASVFLTNPIIVNIAGELRAYSMEMCGVLISLYYLKKIVNGLSISKLLVLALILDVFMTSRYDFVVYAFAISLCVIFLIYKQYGFSTKAIFPTIVYSCVTLLGVAFVYFVSMKYQNPTAGPLSYVPYFRRDFNKIIISDISIKYYIILGYVLLCHFRKIPHNFYICISLFINTLFIIISFANRIPWDEYRTLAVTICQHLAIGIMLLRHLSGKKIVFVILLLCLCGFHRYKKDGFSIRLFGEKERQVLYKEMDFCINNKNNGVIFISAWFNPSIRYLFEECDWNKRFAQIYPQQFYFGNCGSHNKDFVMDIKKAENINTHLYFLAAFEASPAYSLCEGCKYVYEKTTQENIDK